jgi:outer membrane protein
MRKLLLLTIGFIFITPAHADMLGVRLSGGMFKYSLSGTVRDNAVATQVFDVKNDLGWKDETKGMGYLYIEHPIPLIPNFRIGTTSLQLGGTNTLTKDVMYNGTQFNTNDKVTSDLDLSHNEIALYYEVIDTGIDLDLGLNFKFFNGKVFIKDTSGKTATTTLSSTVPMLYGAVTIPIPGTGFKLAGDLTTTSYQNDNITDYMVRVRYDTDFALGVELGYRSLHIKYEDTGANEYANLDMKGPYLMATLSF